MPRLISLALIALTSTACDRSEYERSTAPKAVSLEELVTDPLRLIGAVGLVDSEDGNIGRVVDAQISPVDSTVWVIDNVPPFVRQFTFDGRHVRRFVRRGGGPLEAAAVGSLAVNDSLLAIVHSGMVSIYRHDGSPYALHVRLGLHAERIGTGCAGEWLVSGRKNSASSTASAGVFVARITRDSASSRLIKADTGTTTLHGPRRFHASAAGPSVFDIRSNPRSFAVLSCPSYEWTVVAEAPPERITETWRGTGSQRTILIQYAPDGKRVTGFARYGTATIVSFLVPRGSNLALISDSGDSIYAAVPGFYEILDVQRNLAAVAVSDPAPAVLLLSAADLVASIHRR